MPQSEIEDAVPQTRGIVERLVRDDADRKRFLKGVGAAGAASFGAFVLAACGSSSSSSSSATTSSAAPAATASTSSASAGGASGDLAILNYALTLEYLESQFYRDVAAANLFHGAQLSLLKTFGAQEQSHVEALTAAIKAGGGTPVAKVTGKFPLTSASSVAMLAYTVENLGAAAYLGQAANIQSKQVLAAALSIHTVEARHASTLGTLVHNSLTPDGAFAKPAGMTTVLAAVKPFLA